MFFMVGRVFKRVWLRFGYKGRVRLKVRVIIWVNFTIFTSDFKVFFMRNSQKLFSQLKSRYYTFLTFVIRPGTIG